MKGVLENSPACLFIQAGELPNDHNSMKLCPPVTESQQMKFHFQSVGNALSDRAGKIVEKTPVRHGGIAFGFRGHHEAMQRVCIGGLICLASIKSAFRGCFGEAGIATGTAGQHLINFLEPHHPSAWNAPATFRPERWALRKFLEGP